MKITLELHLQGMVWTLNSYSFILTSETDNSYKRHSIMVTYGIESHKLK